MTGSSTWKELILKLNKFVNPTGHGVTGGSTAKLDSGGTEETESAGMEGDTDLELATEDFGAAAGAGGGAVGEGGAIAGVLATWRWGGLCCSEAPSCWK